MQTAFFICLAILLHLFVVRLFLVAVSFSRITVCCTFCFLFLWPVLSSSSLKTSLSFPLPSPEHKEILAQLCLSLLSLCQLVLNERILSLQPTDHRRQLLILTRVKREMRRRSEQQSVHIAIASSPRRKRKSAKPHSLSRQIIQLETTFCLW